VSDPGDRASHPENPLAEKCIAAILSRHLI
jgi:hypothetical protein